MWHKYFTLNQTDHRKEHPILNILLQNKQVLWLKTPANLRANRFQNFISPNDTKKHTITTSTMQINPNNNETRYRSSKTEIFSKTNFNHTNISLKSSKTQNITKWNLISSITPNPFRHKSYTTSWYMEMGKSEAHLSSPRKCFAIQELAVIFDKAKILERERKFIYIHIYI